MRKVGLLASAMLFSSNVLAADGISVEYGSGNATDMARVGVLWNWDMQWFIEGDWLVTGFWEATLGTWRANSAAGNNQTIDDVGVAPVFRLQQKSLSSFAPYAEGAFGLHLIDPTFINSNRKFGSSLQFGDHIGFGVRFGDRHQFDFEYRCQHLSNGGIKQPNQGINFNQVRFTYLF